MSVAFATFFTSSNLSGGNVASDYGFHVTETGIGTKVVNVGDSGEAFNVTDYTDMAIMAPGATGYASALCRHWLAA